jgi:hypothetical protein
MDFRERALYHQVILLAWLRGMLTPRPGAGADSE